MEIRIMLFILMMMVMPVSYAACYSELSVQHNLVVQGDFALTQTQMATYEHNFNDSSCVSTNTITPMSPSDIIVGLYNDTIKLNLHFVTYQNLYCFLLKTQDFHSLTLELFYYIFP